MTEREAEMIRHAANQFRYRPSLRAAIDAIRKNTSGCEEEWIRHEIGIILDMYVNTEHPYVEKNGPIANIQAFEKP